MLKANTTVYPRPNNQTPLDIPTLGLKRYELSNHLGNVLSTVSDLKTPLNTDSDPETDAFDAIVWNQQAYYPFGMIMPELEYTAPGEGNTRFGFNGKENDDEVKGKGAQQDYGMRYYDPRLGKFLSIDPLSLDYPWYTPYQFAGNTPIQAIDLEGAEELKVASNATSLMAKATLLTTKSTELNELRNSISQPDKARTHLVYFANCDLSWRDRGVLGETFDELKDRADLAKKYWEVQAKYNNGIHPSDAEYNINSGQESGLGHESAYLFQVTGISYEEVLSAKQENIFLVVIDFNANGSELNSLKTLSHEIDQHLTNDLNGLNMSPTDEHYKNFNIVKGSKEDLKFRIYGNNSPPIDKIKPDSRQGKLNTEIDRVYE
jgi:RHS repeat-associated protein